MNKASIMSINNLLINKVSFGGGSRTGFLGVSSRESSDDSDKRKEAAKDAVKGGGAVAATSAALSNGKKVDMFRKAGKASKDLEKGSIALKNVGQATKKATGLFAKCKKAYSTTKSSIVEWGRTVKASRFVKPLLESRAFRWGAGLAGYGFGFVTLVTGLGDIAKFTLDSINKYQKFDND